MRGIWSVRASTMSEHEAYLVITFVSSTHVLAMNADNELDEAAADGFAADAMTLFCGSMDDDQIVQARAKRNALIPSLLGGGNVASSMLGHKDRVCVSGHNQLTTLHVHADNRQLLEATSWQHATRRCIAQGCWKGVRDAQVTANEARLLDAATGSLVTTWHTDTQLSKVVSNGANLVVATSGKGHVFLLDVGRGTVACRKEAQLGVEVACLDVAPWALAGAGHARACGCNWPERVHRAWQGPNRFVLPLSSALQATILDPGLRDGLDPSRRFHADGRVSPGQVTRAGGRADGSRLVAVGTWASRLLIVSLPACAVLRDHDLQTSVIPRSTLFMDIGDDHAVLLGMGDGQLAHWRVRPLAGLQMSDPHSWLNVWALQPLTVLLLLCSQTLIATSAASVLSPCTSAASVLSPLLLGAALLHLRIVAHGGALLHLRIVAHGGAAPCASARAAQVADDGALSDRKLVSIGVKPIALSAFTVAGTPYVFAATDRPAVVYARSGKLVYSPVNESDVTMLARFSTEAFPGSLALAKDDCLMIAQIDAIQKLHVRCAVMQGRLGNRRADICRRSCLIWLPFSLCG
jgi:Mono-functional DNA-alkylating methyl methanesulfonate N-term